MRRLLLALLALTLVVLLADVAGAPLGPLRGAGAAVLGPVERLVAPGGDRVDALARENLRLEEQVRRLEEQRRVASQADDLPVTGITTTTARVVALERAGASGPERVTIDVGRRDGVRPDSAVIAPGASSVASWRSAGGAPTSRSSAPPRRGRRAHRGEGGHRHPDRVRPHHLPRRGRARRHPARARRRRGRRRGRHPGQPEWPPLPAGHHRRHRHGRRASPGALTDTARVDPAVELTSLDVVAVVTGREEPPS
ncbi:hypothetical protein [Janibacter sp. DB-40]|uniref:hypothetical protein n=1 Tax=Janibacter sp. DB-40 TaxID=3028808 RepID=UPI00240549B2|nr:hypothetical protein [Janibacter sp. DB-40]